MLRLSGSKKTLCDGVTRRDLLHVGGLGALGLTLADDLRLRAAPRDAAVDDASFGRAKSCVLVFLFGSPPQHETFDPKPSAPPEIQGEMGAIDSRLPGLRIGEGLPETADVADRLTIVRSLRHPYPLHGVAYALTGMSAYTPQIEAQPRHPQHWPFVGSVVDYVDRRRAAAQPGAASPAVPRNLALPWVMGSRAVDYPPLAGPYAAFLGDQFDPVWTDFRGEGTRVVPRVGERQTVEVRDPFGGCTPDGRFELSATAPLPGLSRDRFDARQLLLSQFDAARGWLDRHAAVRSYGEHEQAAFGLLADDRVRRALDIQRESPEVRDRYGMNLFGQSLLAARRLVEAGGRFVSVFRDPFGPFGGSVWDTHANHFPRLKEYLLPVFDRSFSAFIRDLDERRLLDETLVLCLSEHGRTPKIDSKPRGAGRHHWSNAYSAVMAGGGVARGRVVGRTDAIGGDVTNTPISPKDVLATTFHLLGIDQYADVHDRLGRPQRVSGDGRVRSELLA